MAGAGDAVDVVAERPARASCARAQSWLAAFSEAVSTASGRWPRVRTDCAWRKTSRSTACSSCRLRAWAGVNPSPGATRDRLGARARTLRRNDSSVVNPGIRVACSGLEESSRTIPATCFR